MSENVAIIGASSKPDRYSYQALELLMQHGHQVFPIHPKESQILNQKVYSSLEQIQENLDTITMYVGADISNTLADSIIAIKPKRVIFNPGAENAVLANRLSEQGIQVINACTLVMLRTGQY